VNNNICSSSFRQGPTNSKVLATDPTSRSNAKIKALVIAALRGRNTSERLDHSSLDPDKGKEEEDSSREELPGARRLTNAFFAAKLVTLQRIVQRRSPKEM